MVRTALGTRVAKAGRRKTAPKSGADRGKAASTSERGKGTAKSERVRAERSRSFFGRRTAKPKPAPEPEPRRQTMALPLRILAMLVAFAAMVAFAVALAHLTLEPSPASTALIHNNLHPGRSLRAYLDQPEMRDAIKQIGGNILLGIPFGVLLPVVAPRTRGILRVLLLTAVVMMLVELVQGALITGRSFDVDDVILNTTGALIGYLLLGRRLGRAVHPRKRLRA
ncbi:VanZ family protein [Streptomyces sp. NPDC007084]|uniref:VanZ family protein n=1 Tax=Streptomyces sp. NPDC007084 TaxID=3154313 RepID=UPI0034525951